MHHWFWVQVGNNVPCHVILICHLSLFLYQSVHPRRAQQSWYYFYSTTFSPQHSTPSSSIHRPTTSLVSLCCPQCLSVFTQYLGVVFLEGFSPVNFQTANWKTVCASTSLVFIILSHALSLPRSHYQQWAASLLKSHKEHNKAPPSANLLALGNPEGHAGRHELGGTHTHTWHTGEKRKWEKMLILVPSWD